MTKTYLLIIWGLAAGYLIAHYLFFHLRLVLFKGQKRKPMRQGVSVIICACNEAENLRNHLPAILDQDFRKFEVIVVNDGSTDQTAEALKELKKKSRRLKVVEVSPEKAELNPGKKYALTAGILKARNRFLLHTDADCEPASNNWLKSMASHFRTRDVVLGYSPYRPVKGFTSHLTEWETLLTAQQYFSFSLAGLPYMGVGRNLGYAKGLFFNSTQFRKHLHLASGDDDLLIGERARASEYSY
ncbi:MAG: glycosyltransferase [Owenweeksia sp.]|nr:glycosyltransferase [Owenweeksia sp.]